MFHLKTLEQLQYEEHNANQANKEFDEAYHRYRQEEIEESAEAESERLFRADHPPLNETDYDSHT